MSNNYKESFEKSRIAGSIAAGALDEVTNHSKYHIIVLDLLEVNFQN